MPRTSKEMRKIILHRFLSGLRNFIIKAHDRDFGYSGDVTGFHLLAPGDRLNHAMSRFYGLDGLFSVWDRRGASKAVRTALRGKRNADFFIVGANDKGNELFAFDTESGNRVFVRMHIHNQRHIIEIEDLEFQNGEYQGNFVAHIITDRYPKSGSIAHGAMLSDAVLARIIEKLDYVRDVRVMVGSARYGRCRTIAVVGDNFLVAYQLQGCPKQQCLEKECKGSKIQSFALQYAYEGIAVRAGDNVSMSDALVTVQARGKEKIIFQPSYFSTMSRFRSAGHVGEIDYAQQTRQNANFYAWIATISLIVLAVFGVVGFFFNRWYQRSCRSSRSNDLEMATISRRSADLSNNTPLSAPEPIVMLNSADNSDDVKNNTTLSAPEPKPDNEVVLASNTSEVASELLNSQSVKVDDQSSELKLADTNVSTVKRSRHDRRSDSNQNKREKKLQINKDEDIEVLCPLNNQATNNQQAANINEEQTDTSGKELDVTTTSMLSSVLMSQQSENSLQYS